jgi:hypothetical protein
MTLVMPISGKGLRPSEPSRPGQESRVRCCQARARRQTSQGTAGTPGMGVSAGSSPCGLALPPLGAVLLPHKGAGRMDALSLCCVYQNTRATAAPRAMARWRITLALWIRLETSNARSLRSLSSNGTPYHPLPLDLVCRRGLQVCVRGIGMAHSAADADGPAKRRGIGEDGSALLDVLLGLGRPDPPVLHRCRDGRCQPATQVPRWKALRQLQSRRACTAGHGDSVSPASITASATPGCLWTTSQHCGTSGKRRAWTPP